MIYNYIYQYHSFMIDRHSFATRDMDCHIFQTGVLAKRQNLGKAKGLTWKMIYEDFVEGCRGFHF